MPGLWLPAVPSVAEVDGGHGAGHQLGADVLDAGGAFTHGGEPAEVAAAGKRRAFDEFAGCGAAFEGLVQAAKPGERHEVDHRCGVVRLEEVTDFRDGTPVRHEGLPECPHNPLGVGIADGGLFRFVRLVAQQQVQPLLEGAG